MRQPFSALLALALVVAGLVGPRFGLAQSALEARDCTSCHEPDTDDGSGPSWKKIAQAYSSEKKLLRFLEGKGNPIVDPPQYPQMQTNVEKTKRLSPAERLRLAREILGHKQPR